MSQNEPTLSDAELRRWRLTAGTPAQIFAPSQKRIQQLCTALLAEREQNRALLADVAALVQSANRLEEFGWNAEMWWPHLNLTDDFQRLHDVVSEVQQLAAKPSPGADLLAAHAAEVALLQDEIDRQQEQLLEAADELDEAQIRRGGIHAMTDLTPERMSKLRELATAALVSGDAVSIYITATDPDTVLALLDAAEELAQVKADNATLAETTARIVLAHDQLFAADTPARPDAFAFRNEVTRAARIITEPHPGDSIRAELAQVKADNARLTAALREIEEGRGAFSRDHLTHAQNTVSNLIGIARAALAEPPKEVQG